MNAKKCTCSLGNKVTCPNCSTVAMRIMLKNGNNHLKIMNSNGKRVNPVWYSHLQQNTRDIHHPEYGIITGMIRRFKTSHFATATNVLIFYNNSTNTEIHREYVK